MKNVMANESQIITPFAMGNVENLPESAWLGHLPFARWLIEAMRPRKVVELGTHRGASFLAFCQAMAELDLDGEVHAIDTWEGDEHAGFYGDEIYQSVLALMSDQLSRVGRLNRKTFDDARPEFSENSVDILHIDGLHTYDAVRHDFELWEPTVVEGGVILFHDISETKDDFGVWKLWDELKPGRPNFEFFHSHGLGVLGVGSSFAAPLDRLFSASSKETMATAFRKQFELQGQRYQLLQEIMFKDRHISILKQELSELKGSKSWKITKPLRGIDFLAKKILG